MNDLGQELQDALGCFLQMLQPPTLSSAAYMVPPNNNHLSWMASSSSSSFSSTSSSSNSRDGYEIRRAARRLDRVVHSIGKYMNHNNDNHNFLFENPPSCVQVQNNLVTLLTIVGQSMESFFETTHSNKTTIQKDDLYNMYNASSTEACRILHELLLCMNDTNDGHSMITLQPEQVDALLDRVATMVCQTRNQQEHSRSSHMPQEPLLLGAMVTLINTNLSLLEQQQQQLLLPLLKPVETIRLVQLLIPQCMDDLLIRWSSSSPQSTENHSILLQDARIQLRVLVWHLFRHLLRLHHHHGNVDMAREDPLQRKAWFQQVFLQMATRDETIPNQNDDNGFFETCLDFGVELVEYALDVLNGASLVLTTTTMQPQQETDHFTKCIGAIQDAVRHVCLATTTMEILQDLGIMDTNKNNTTTSVSCSLRSLLVAYSTFCASTLFEAMSRLIPNEPQESEHVLHALQITTSELLVQLTRITLEQQDDILEQNEAMENAVAIAILQGMQVPESVQDLECILDFVTRRTRLSLCDTQQQEEERRRFSKKQKTSNSDSALQPCRGANMTQTDHLQQVLQAAAMSSLLLPNQGVAPSRVESKNRQVNCLLQTISALSDNTTKIDPWQSLLYKKISENRGTTRKHDG